MMNYAKSLQLFFRFGYVFLVASGFAQFPLHAGTVWNGPIIMYTQPGTDGTDPANWDMLTANVAFTRNGTEGLYNPIQEGSYDRLNFTSPADTEWSYGTIDQASNLSYTTWANMSGHNPPSMVGQQAVVHLITDNIYISIMFTEWDARGGIFAYKRSTPSVSAPPPTVNITSPTNGSTFAAPANVKITANASVSSGTVSNVSFFRAATLIGSSQSTPFSVTASNLATSNYSLTAVASAGGVSSTSAPINITVVTPVAVTSSAPKITNGQFSFNYTANPGLSYVVQQSSNLTTWLPVSTNTASANPVHFTDTFLSNKTRFYRVGRLPNP